MTARSSYLGKMGRAGSSTTRALLGTIGVVLSSTVSARHSLRTFLAGLVLLGMVFITARPGSVQAILPADEPLPGTTTLQMIENTIIPPRDRLDLARRLLGVADIPAPPTEAPPELEIGDVLTFWADNLELDTSFQVDAELAYKTEHIYMFVEVGQNVDEAGLKRSAEAFENVIRPKVHEVFGTEWFPGIDADPHLYILHASNLGSWVAAYYASSSEYPTVAVNSSNEHEMFYVNLDTMRLAVSSPYYEGMLAHEFQHMVQWNVDSNEDTWLGEGLSELSTMITGYGDSGSAQGFLAQPDIQLNHWPEEPGDREVHYGAAFLFTAYFLQRYGEEAITTLVRDPENGMKSVQNALESINATDPATGRPVTTDDLLMDWVVANWVQDPSVGDGRYAYDHPDLEHMFSARGTRELQPDAAPVSLEAPQWGAHYLGIRGGSAAERLRVSFQGSQTVSIVPSRAHSGTFMWWSNRGDQSDMRLTHPFDLTGVNSATLNFWTWYYIEQLWDYAYVMVSTDGGTTWTPIATSRTAGQDPHGVAYGSGYTGQSGGWVQESIDLTPYAGQQILVRFEYITDDAVTQPGMLIDDVTVPEIGYSENFENGLGDWQSEGWLLMDNVLPQDFAVQLVQTGNTAQPVTRWLSRGDTVSGEWEITVGGEYGDATVVVSGLAPVTTEPAAYTITVSPVE